MFKQISSRNGGASSYSSNVSSAFSSDGNSLVKGSSAKAINEKKIANAAERLLVVVILTICCIEGFISRLFAVIRFESIIHEFDPWFNYRATSQLVENGWYEFLNWFDDRAWYPLGRIVGGTVRSDFLNSLIFLLDHLSIRNHCKLSPSKVRHSFFLSEEHREGTGIGDVCLRCIRG